MLPTLVPFLFWAAAECGRETPKLEYTAKVNPEQSAPLVKLVRIHTGYLQTEVQNLLPAAQDFRLR